MTYPNTTSTNFLDSSANARTSSGPFVDVFMPRDPTPQDITSETSINNYATQKKWLNTSKNTLWELKNYASSNGVTTANWIKLGSASLVETLTGNNTSVQVPPTSFLDTPPNNIYVQGDGTYIYVTGTAATNTLLINQIAGSVVSNIEVDAHTSPGTNPVVPNASGTITVTGGQVAAGTTTHVIRTDSLVANTYTVEVQRSQAVGSSTVGDNGVSHFNSAQFTVDSNAFVSIKGGSGGAVQGIIPDAHTAPGTSPVLPDSSGNITVTGGQVAAGTTVNVIRTDSLADNTYTVEVQRSQAVASSTIGDNGVCHFNSTYFSVDANGFVSVTGTLPSKPSFFAYLTSNVSNVTGDGTPYDVICDAELFDTTSNYDTSTGIFTAPSAGVYQFNAAAGMNSASASTTSGNVYFSINGGTFFVQGTTGDPNSIKNTFNDFSFVVSMTYHLAQNDTVQLHVQCDLGTKTTSMNGIFDADVYATWFSGFKAA